MPDLSLQLDELARAGLVRRRRVVERVDGPHLTVEGRRYLAFCSNDYLGLAHHPALVEAACRGAERYGVGAGASALISGHTEAHEALEARLARFVRLPRALHFGAGYLANLGLVAALAGRGGTRSEEHTSELQSRENLVCRLLLEKKKKIETYYYSFKKKKQKRTNIK